jgi:tetratricopeptide (TPR) repeat protein
MLVASVSADSMVDHNEDAGFRKQMQVERSSQASPSDIMSHPLNSSNTNPDLMNEGSDELEKPFFIMDWLEQVDPMSIELAQKLLSRSSAARKRIPSLENGADLPTISTALSLNDLRDDGLTPSIPSASSHFLQRSVAIGNGYNAKGIEKARLGLWDEALSCWNSALEIRTQILSESHIDVANTCNNIGIALGKLNRFKEAIASLNRALEIRVRHNGGPEHVQVAATLHNMGNVYQQTGDLESAIQYFCQCKLLQEAIFGTSDHVEVARSCIAMGHTYFQGDALLDAREAYLDALSIFHRVGLPDSDPEVQSTLCDIRDLEKKIASQKQHNN